MCDKCDRPALRTRLCLEHFTAMLDERRQSSTRVYIRDYSSYGITESDYLAMLEAQGGTCAICHQAERIPGRSLAIDHDHETGRVRGLLCASCNRGIGMLGDDVDRLASAIEYLRVDRD